MKTITITHDDDAIDWPALSAIYLRERGKARLPELLRRAFQASYVTVFALDGNRVIGAGRALSDGLFNATIMDVVVDRDHQDMGVGRAMMESLLARLDVERIDLGVVPGKEGFYEKLGFRRHESAYCLRPGDTMPDAATEATPTYPA